MQSSTQEIGEELVNGVIYSISLRKAQVHHGANKGQRWLAVSAGLGGLRPMAFLPEGPQSPVPQGVWPPPLLHCPSLDLTRRKVAVHTFVGT